MIELSELTTAPDFIKSDTQFLCKMGSHAYGINGPGSDIDIYGFCIPPLQYLLPHTTGHIEGFGRQQNNFEQFQVDHIKNNEELYDVSIYNIAKFLHLCMDNNPNMIDCLFVPDDCIIYASPIADLILRNRHLLLHKGCYFRFMGYAESQWKKIRNKNPVGKRKIVVDTYGFDCYEEKTTEFLTRNGWKKFDEIGKNDTLATFNIKENKVQFQKPITKTDKKYTGYLYTINSYMSKFCITENHNVLVSQAHRGLCGHKYDPKFRNWQLVRLSDIVNKKLKYKPTYFHIRRGLPNNIKNYNIEKEYLELAGLFLSDGTLQFRKNKNGIYPRCCAISQTDKGKPKEVARAIQRIKRKFNIKQYTYKRKIENRYVKETTYRTDRLTASRIFKDFGHSKNKHLPKWCKKLSYEQVLILWNSMCLGDGTNNNRGQTLYTSLSSLADQIQEIMFLSGHICSLNGPYFYKRAKNKYGNIPMYQIYRSRFQNKFNCIGFKKLRKNKKCKKKQTENIIEEFVKDKRVVCFSVKNGTLITRNNGKIAIQGNCKYASHLYRLANECEQILKTGTLDLRQSKEQMLLIRKGEVPLSELEKWFNEKKLELKQLYETSSLQHSPDQKKIKDILIQCLEMKFGNLKQFTFKED